MDYEDAKVTNLKNGSTSFISKSSTKSLEM